MNYSIPYKLSATNDKFTSRSGLILIAEILRQLDVGNLAKRYFPAPGGNRGFSAATYIQAFVLMRMEGIGVWRISGSASRIGPVVDAGDEAVVRHRCAGQLAALGPMKNGPR